MVETITDHIKLIVFQLKDKEYAIAVNEVLSIEKVDHITRVPGTSKYVKGVINLRGIVVPIIDLRSRFEIDEAVYTENTRVIIAAINEIQVGLIVDSANDVIDIAGDALEPSPEVIGTEVADYIKAVAKINSRLLILIDLEKVLAASEES
ncbi:chemotaxis protein CheW [Cytobacillus purgationiresistens]|uniref:Purine-binding chemotaxis protein CheW n=1 Tax=Cytobacillus purgationiresistens TaxID=863449 RepID=A0ABU0AG22_9BACI|nr:chemotaxis protein CheW [Cytobacillus purgationiresistens]MDQ0270207.1 purine-binding chemotaxis protein CheW [Cytobacillus purgationiresistens]